ncbi:Predicted membrane protein [Friedmanniella luteola]|uniref:Predicted membrane protein n=1 Tax=Friedmanniella luteola TaxID=546871 RepID=A0A1H1VYB4_9ACTN|nr:DUF2207 domain-containing protein [Friedmanniella luteola]SDS89857.1 Predicted membrane protein [Friedmanniella luteola]
MSGRAGPLVPVALRRLLLASAALGLALGGTVVAAPPALAATEDQIDSFRIAYDLQPSGVLQVEETIVWRFGADSGRHGIQRDLVEREPFDDTQDAVYDVTDIRVSSPDPVSTQYSSRTTEDDGGRTELLNVRIGDPDRTISGPTATYVLSYRVTGAVRGSPGYDELFWDAPGFGNPRIEDLQITAAVPGGAQEVSCFVGPPGRQSTTPCPTARKTADGAAFAATDVAQGSGLSFGVKIAPGLVADNRPHLEPDGSELSAGERAGLVGAGVAGLGLLVGSPLVGVLWWRRHGRDQRYEGLAPGTTPYAGQTARVVPNDPDLPIPVAFAPPRIPVAEAGLLLDGQVDARETAATIVDLAVRGALQVHSTSEDDFRVTLVDPDRATAPHEMVLLTDVFGGRPPGATTDLSTRGSMLSAHRAMTTSVINQVTARGWFRKVPSGTATGSAGFGLIAVVAFAAFGLGAWVLWVVLPLLPVLVTYLVIRSKLRRGQRTADGRAVCDQVEGFRTYLATAEADQLRFEEGEDIFSKYLPWAIVFELADRWADLCGQLAAAGRLPDTTPSWYTGNFYGGYFNTAFLTSNLTAAATPAPSTSGSSGTGFGGGSSFGGGGFSGGGGGGGGSSSW